ncbi:MAG: hypothetical protein VYE40_10560, partial [Myxococcota bacterium]|nr:hypothetical protein [Myxococcota bacterium]
MNQRDAHAVNSVVRTYDPGARSHTNITLTAHLLTPYDGENHPAMRGLAMGEGGSCGATPRNKHTSRRKIPP